MFGTIKIDVIPCKVNIKFDWWALIPIAFPGGMKIKIILFCYHNLLGTIIVDYIIFRGSWSIHYNTATPCTVGVILSSGISWRVKITTLCIIYTRTQCRSNYQERELFLSCRYATFGTESWLQALPGWYWGLDCSYSRSCFCKLSKLI